MLDDLAVSLLKVWQVGCPGYIIVLGVCWLDDLAVRH